MDNRMAERLSFDAREELFRSIMAQPDGWKKLAWNMNYPIEYNTGLSLTKEEKGRVEMEVYAAMQSGKLTTYLDADALMRDVGLRIKLGRL